MPKPVVTDAMEALHPTAEVKALEESFGRAMYSEGSPPSFVADHAIVGALARGIRELDKDLDAARYEASGYKSDVARQELVFRVYVKFVENITATKAATADEIREAATRLLGVMY